VICVLDSGTPVRMKQPRCSATAAGKKGTSQRLSEAGMQESRTLRAPSHRVIIINAVNLGRSTNK